MHSVNCIVLDEITKVYGFVLFTNIEDEPTNDAEELNIKYSENVFNNNSTIYYDISDSNNESNEEIFKKGMLC